MKLTHEGGGLFSSLGRFIDHHLERERERERACEEHAEVCVEGPGPGPGSPLHSVTASST